MREATRTAGGSILFLITLRLNVDNEGKHFDAQTRAYAEYRAFSGLVGDAPRIGDVVIRLKRPAGAADENRTICAIEIRLNAGEVPRVHATGQHIDAAIDKAVSRIPKAR